MADLAGARVVVTGAAGFVGSAVVRALLAQDAAVTAVVRPGSTLWRLADVASQVGVEAVDVLDPKALRAALRRSQPEYLIHLVAKGGHPMSPSARRSMVEVATGGVLNLVSGLEGLGVRRVVDVGSSLEYGPVSGPIVETDALRPTTLRGAAKAVESILFLHLTAAAGLSGAVLRPFSVYGPRESPERFVPVVLCAALNGREVALTERTARHDFVFVDDVAEACVLSLTAPDTVTGEAFNIGSGVEVTNEELVAAVERVTGRRVETRPGALPSRPADTEHWCADVTRARILLGWSPRHLLSQGLAKTLAWQRSDEGAAPRQGGAEFRAAGA